MLGSGVEYFEGVGWFVDFVDFLGLEVFCVVVVFDVVMVGFGFWWNGLVDSCFWGRYIYFFLVVLSILVIIGGNGYGCLFVIFVDIYYF